MLGAHRDIARHAPGHSASLFIWPARMAIAASLLLAACGIAACDQTDQPSQPAGLSSTADIDASTAEHLATLQAIEQELRAGPKEIPIIVEEPQPDALVQEILNDLQISLITTAYQVPSPGVSLCAQWVCNVFVSDGYLVPIYPAAYDYYNEFCYSNTLSELRVGMIVAGMGTNPYGHIGIYVGNGIVLSSETWYGEGTIIERDLWDFMEMYGKNAEVRWGWMNGFNLLTGEKEY